MSFVKRPSSRRKFEVIREELDEGIGFVYRTDDPSQAQAFQDMLNGQPVDDGAQVVMRFISEATDETEHVVYALAYCPPAEFKAGDKITREQYDKHVDTYGTFMNKADMRKMAHLFMERSRMIDQSHDMKPIPAVPVESFIVEGAPWSRWVDEGSWVLGIKIHDDNVWQAVQRGDYEGLSIYMLAGFEPVEVEVVDGDGSEGVKNGNVGDVAGAPGLNTRSTYMRDALPYNNLPVAPEDTTWSASVARKDVAEWATTDGAIDWSKYARAFLYADPENNEQASGYKLPFATVFDGELQAVPRAITNAAGRLDGTDIPAEDNAKIREHMDRYYKRFNRVPPWEQPVQRANEEGAMSLYMDQLNERLKRNEPENRAQSAIYMLEGFVFDALYSGPAEAEAQLVALAEAFDDAHSFIAENVTAYNDAAYARSEAPDDAARLALRAEMLAIEAPVVTPAVVPEAGDAGAAPAVRDDGTPAPAAEPAVDLTEVKALREQVEAITGRVESLEGEKEQAVARSTEQITAAETALADRDEKITALVARTEALEGRLGKLEGAPVIPNREADETTAAARSEESTFEVTVGGEKRKLARGFLGSPMGGGK